MFYAFFGGFDPGEGFFYCIKISRNIDPACGSGNFLTETYISLRRLENEVIRSLIDAEKGAAAGQIMLVLPDQFIHDGAVRGRINGLFHALAVEMEGGAVAQACYMHGVPCGVLRSISDQADGHSEMDYPTFTRLAASHSQQVVERLLTA